MTNKKLSAYCVLALMLIAISVFVGIVNGVNMWAWIAVYWAVLTVKNMADHLGGR